jgi:hypothetical protein
MLKISKKVVTLAAVVIMCITAYGAAAKELPVGFIITKDNIDQIMNDTFDGHVMKDLFMDSIIMQVKDWGLKINLKKTELETVDQRYLDATQKFKGTTKYDPKTRECSGYIAGLPFPDAGLEKDPDIAGDKLLWNYYYGLLTGNTQYVPHSWLIIGADNGLERRQDWFWLRYFMKNRLERFAKGENPVMDEKILTKTLFFITYPYDLKGVGLFTIRWDLPKLEDSWVYVKSVRRTRRLSGGNWIDPVGGLDMLNDDIFVWNGRPSWYKKITLKEKRWILALANDTMTGYHYSGRKDDPAEEFKGVALNEFPHWNPSTLVRWSPREVYVLDGTPPKRHPYSKRVGYIDTHLPYMYMADCYDKNGKYWKFINYSSAPFMGADDYPVMACPQGHYIDFKLRHASVHYCRIWEANPSRVTERDVTLGKLREAGR